MSTDTTTQDGEDRRLPATWEEFQRARREAFEAGAEWELTWAGVMLGGKVACAQEAAFRYPITKRVPRSIELSAKVIARVIDGNVCFRTFDGGHFYATAANFLTPDDIAAVSDLLANPFEEVEG